MLSIVIVNWNTRDLLVRCLESIRRSALPIPIETIVVDNDSTDQSSEAVRNQFPEVLLVEPGVNTGYAAGNNLGFARATGEWVLALNPDTELESDCLGLALEAMGRHPDWGACGAMLVGLDGAVQPSVRGFPSPLGFVGEAIGLAKWFPKSAFGRYRLRDFDYSIEQDAPQPMGTFLLFRRNALEAVGDPGRPFDEDFPIFFNEVDLLKRMAEIGWKCGYVPAARVLHHGGMSTRQVRPNMIWESHRSLIRYFRKHPPGATGFWMCLFERLVLVGALIRARGVHAGFRP